MPSRILHIPLQHSYISLTTPQLVFFGCQSETQRSALNSAVKIGAHLRALLPVNRAERGELGEVGFEFGGGYVKSLVKMTVLKTCLVTLVNYDKEFVKGFDVRLLSSSSVVVRSFTHFEVKPDALSTT